VGGPLLEAGLTSCIYFETVAQMVSIIRAALDDKHAFAPPHLKAPPILSAYSADALVSQRAVGAPGMLVASMRRAATKRALDKNIAMTVLPTSSQPAKPLTKGVPERRSPRVVE
jgi:hypothetical protein